MEAYMNIVHLNLLMNLLSDQYQTASWFAEKLQVSNKTARNLLKELEQMASQHGACLESKSSAGYRLLILDQVLWQQFRLSCQAQEHGNLPQSPEERVQYILEYLVHSKDFVRLDELSDLLYIAKRTLTKDLKEIEGFLQRYRIQLVRKPNHGIRIEGSEFNIRLCLASYIARSKKNKLLPDQTLKRIARCIDDCLHKAAYQLSDVALQNLIVHLFIAIKRIESNHYVPLDEKWLTMLYDPNEYKTACQIVERLQQEFQLSFPEAEIRYTALHLAGKRTLEIDGQKNIVIDPETAEMVDQMLQSVYEAFHFDFRQDLELKMALGQHLIPLKVRVQCDMNMYNPLLKDIKERFALAYTIAAQAGSIIADKYQKILKDDEIGYIALSFALAMERQRNGHEKKNILLVCASGKGSAKLLSYQYRERFGEQLGTITTCDVNHVDAMDYSAIDYLFTTVPIRAKVPVPILEVQYFLNDQDVRSMKKLLSSDHTSVCSRYFVPELFLPHVPGKTKEAILKYMCAEIHKLRPLPPGFLQAVLKREKLARTSFGNQAAMPHPYKAQTQDTFVCTGLLNAPILWDDAEVQAVFLVSIGTQKDPHLQKFYRVMSKFLLNKACMAQLIQQKNYLSFCQLLQQLEQELEELS